MGNFFEKNEHEKYVEQRLSEAYCLGLSSRMEKFNELLKYCDEHQECEKIKRTVEDCIIDLKLRPIY